MSELDIMNLSFYDTMASELQCHVIKFLPIEFIYKNITILNKYHNELVNSNYFFNLLLEYYYPKQKNIQLSSTIKDNFHKIHKIMYRKFKIRTLVIPNINGDYIDKTIILPYNIIASLLNLPILTSLYTDIIGYLRAYDYDIKNLINFKIKNRDVYRVTLFVIPLDELFFKNYYPGNNIKMSFNELFNNIIPMNIKNLYEYHKLYFKIHAITLQIYIKNNINNIDIYYSKINGDKQTARTLFEEVANDYISEYC